MICHDTRCIFIHNRKCAGTSIKATFGLHKTNPDRDMYNDGAADPSFAGRPTDYLVFAVVRNPWDRFVSGWAYCESTRGRAIRDVLCNLPTSGHDYRHLTRPQHETLFHADGRPAFDILLRYEHLQDDFDRLRVLLNRPPCTLLRKQVGTHAPYTQYFNEETRALFAQRYAGDIELFNYEFGRVPPAGDLFDRFLRNEILEARTRG
jgi:hypothetical protein